MINIHFSSKSLLFVIISIEQSLTIIKSKIDSGLLSEDELSDLTNDMCYYEAILADLKRK